MASTEHEAATGAVAHYQQRVDELLDEISNAIIEDDGDSLDSLTSQHKKAHSALAYWQGQRGRTEP